MFPIFFLDEVNELRAHGTWSAESTSGLWWQWLLVDFTGGAWYYPALQVARKMYLTSVMAVAEGKGKAVLVCLLFVADVMHLWLARPFNDIATLWCERISALTNLLAVISVTLPAFGVKILPDMLIIAMATVGTGISAAVASVSSLYSCLRILPSPLACIAGCRDSILCLSKSAAAAVSDPNDIGNVLKQSAKDGTDIVTRLMYDNAKEQAKKKASKKTCTMSCLTRICPRVAVMLFANSRPGEHEGLRDFAEETGEHEANSEVIEIQLGYVDEAKETEHGGSDVNKCDDNGIHEDLNRSPTPQSTVEIHVTASGVRTLNSMSVALESADRGEQAAGLSVRAAVVFEGGCPTSTMRLCDILERSKALHESQGRGLLGSRRDRGFSPDIFTANDGSGQGRERDERGSEVSATEVVSMGAKYMC